MASLTCLALRRRALLRTGLGLALLPAACALPPDDMQPIPEADTATYLLGPGDQVRVITVGEEAVTGLFRIDADGTVDLPLLGQIHAAGLTAAELGQAIAAALHTKRLYRDPSVSVEVAAYRTLAVLGEVNRPGQYPYQPGMTVVLAVASAGGFTYRAVDDRFTVRRTIGGKAMIGSAGPHTRLLPGDEVTVYERQF